MVLALLEGSCEVGQVTGQARYHRLFSSLRAATEAFAFRRGCGCGTSTRHHAVCSRHAAVFMSREPNISTLQFAEPPLSQQASFYMAPRDSSSLV